MRTFTNTAPSPSDRRGATLLVTLGILTVLSVMVVSLLVTSRLQRQAASNDQNRLAARNYMDAGLHLALRQIEDALTYPNYTDEQIPASAYQTHQRLAPVGQWFARHYAETNRLSDDVAFQAPDVLASPTVEGGPYVNLLTPQVLRLVPAALTNGLQLSANETPFFRSGWIPLDLLSTNASVEMRLRSKPARIAFAVFNCSGFIDANTFLNGPTAQKFPRTCFSQGDVTNWLATACNEPAFENLTGLWDDYTLPFFHLSYDPGPDAYPLHYDCFETTTHLGRNGFGAGPTVDLNLPQAYRVMGALKEQANYGKFNLNSFTNFPFRADALSESPWFNDAEFKRDWLDPVTELTRMMAHEEPAATLHRLPSGDALPWSVANFMDEDRIPQISTFSADDDGNQELATRVDYAVEDVPLINKVTVFNIYDDEEVIKAPQKPGYYDLPDSGLSNHYAVAVELWYPFAPKPPSEDVACYVGIYTNAADVVTTTNSPMSQQLMRDWLRWNFGDTSNTVMQTLFYTWGSLYKRAVGPSIWANPLWLTINTDSDLWFTQSMTNHVFWPEAGTNGTYDITANPIWQAFYPETYEEVETNIVERVTDVGGTPVTNQFEVVTTNVYTTVVSTNSVMDWFVPPDTTNRFVVAFHGETPADYPWILWSDPGLETFSTNRMTGFGLADGTEVRLSETNQLTHFFFEDDALWVVVTNTADGGVAFDAVSTLHLLDDASHPLTVTAADLSFSVEIERVKPLPMPDDLGRILDGLMSLLPTNSVSALNAFLMATPEDLEDLDAWDSLFTSLSQIPGIFNKLFPSNNEPTLGNMTEEDRHILWPENSEDKTVLLDQDLDNKLSASEFQGYFWTVYPKQTVNFMTTDPIEGPADENGNQPVATNYHALGAQSIAAAKRNTIWLRPVVTVRTGEEEEEEGSIAGDKIVDEALLSLNNDDPVPVWGWTSVTNLCIPDPRNNAYARHWRAFPDGKKWLDEDVFNTTNLNTGVHELPFIHFDVPLSTIGDIGHVYASYDRSTQDPDDSALPQQKLYDTVTFSTRSGAALLDIFTLSPTNGPRRGLVQANTQHASVIKTLLADVKVGWTNSTEEATLLSTIDTKLENWLTVYTDALTNAPYSMGWRSFADMMPTLSTNRLVEQENVWGGASDLHSKHDYTEDVLRGLVDKVSFRQNIFVIVVAAQALSPASAVLSDQRAAVTVIRDAYTGRWVIHSWAWLSE